MDIDLRRRPNVDFKLELSSEVRQILGEKQYALDINPLRRLVTQSVVARPLSLGLQVFDDYLDSRLSETLDLVVDCDVGGKATQKAWILEVCQREFVARAQVVVSFLVQLLVYTHELYVERVAVSRSMAAG